jgi:hypothetical protein
MTWTRGVLALVAVVAIGYVVLQPEEKPQYIGDFPSQYDSAAQAPPVPPGSPGVTPALDPPPPPTVPAASPAGLPRVLAEGPQPLRPAPTPASPPAFRQSAPGTDTGLELPLGLGSSVSGLTPGSPEYQEQLSGIRDLPACADLVVRPDGAAFSCLTGEFLGFFELPEVPALPLP